MNRRLGAFESALALSNDFSPLNVVAVLRMAAGPEPSAWTRALATVQSRHPALRTRIVRRPRGYAFEPGEALEIPLRCVPREDPERWVTEAETELNQPFAGHRGPLLRAAIVGSGQGACELLLTFHHSIMDGASALQLCRELLLLAAGEGTADLEPSSLPEPPTAERLFPESYQGWRRHMRFAGFACRQMGGELHDLWRARGRWHPPPTEPCRSRILSFQLSESATAALTRRARQARVTLHSVFDAALLLAVARRRYRGERLPLRHLVFANLRPYLVPPVDNEPLGAYFSMLRFSTLMHPDRELWPLAAEINAVVHSAAKRGDKYAFFLASILFMRAILGLGRQRMAATALSYTGVTKLGPPDPFEVLGVHAFASNFRLGPEASAQIRWFAGRLWWDILYLDSEMTGDEAKQLAGEIQQTLSHV
ncbi:MAG: condensation domain-containing protein [Acidobacteriota bacterium]